jgi:hypothetical protein
MNDPIKTKIQELCPDVMELKFGCDVVVKGIREDNPGCEYDVVVDDRKLDDGRIELGYFGRVPRKDIQQVLGSPITLAVVLRAISKRKRQKPQFGESEMYSITENGLFFHLRHIDTKGERTEWPYIGKLRAEWNLTKDNYDDQTEETKKFIGNLLGV